MKENITAEEIAKHEKQNEEWRCKYGKKLPELEEQFNDWLLEGEEGRKKVLEFFQKEKEFRPYIHTEKIVIFGIFVSAYELERNMGMENGILERNMKISDYIKLYNELKFRIWRMEFGFSDSEEELRKYIRNYNLSWYLMQSIIYTTAYFKEDTLNKISSLMKEE